MNENVTTKVKIGVVRFSYVHIFQPEAAAEGAEKKYSLSLLIPKSNTVLVGEIKAAIEAAVKAEYPAKRPANLRLPLRDGDTERDEDEAYKGCWFLNASSKKKPGIVKLMKIDGETKMVEVTNEEDVYSGCYGYASVNFYCYDKAGNKGVTAGLSNVLKIRDGEFLGGRVSAETDFGELDLDSLTPDDEDEVF